VSPIELQVIGYFSDSDAARRALDVLHKDPRGGRLEVVVRVKDKPHQTVPISLSHTRAALVKGVGIGGTTGLLMGAVVGWAGYRFEGLEPSIILAFGALGLGLGSLGAALIGPMNPHPLIEKLEKGRGATLVVDADTPQDRAWAEQVMRDYGADIEHKAPRLKAALARS
jgi:hypothetical protein